jgi:hypothetical protein
MEMAAYSATLAPQKPAGRNGVGAVCARARASNKPSASSVDGRSRVGRRVRDLAGSFASQLGGWATLSDTMAANVRRAAELSALAERARAEALRDGNVDPLALVRLEGAAGRAVKALALDRKREPAAQSPSEYLTRRATERAGERSGSAP